MELTIKIDSRSKQAKVFFEYLKTLPFVQIQTPLFNKETEKAIKDAKIGKTTKTTLSDLREQLYS